MTTSGWDRRLAGTALAVLGVVTMATACTGDDDDDPAEIRERVVTELATDLEAESDGVLDPDQATCVAEELVDELGVDRLELIVAAAAASSGDDDLRARVVEAFAACDALEALIEDDLERDG